MSHDIKVARFGDNMRNVAVTEGDKIEAQIQFGWTVDYFCIGDLVVKINKVLQKDIDNSYEEFKNMYIMDIGENNAMFYERQVKEQIKIEIALRNFLKVGNYTAFITNFEGLYGMKQFPGFAVQRLNAEGYGFAGEGDWKTATLDRLIKVNPTFTSDKPKLVIKPLGIGDREDPARLIFNGSVGSGVAISMLDLRTHYRLIINELTAVKPNEDMPNLPVAKMVLKPEPDFSYGVKSWIYAGGGHHTVATLKLTVDQI